MTELNAEVNSTAIVRTANDQLLASLAKTSLKDLVKSRTRRSLLLVDVSGSMSEPIAAGGRKIDALRTVVATLREGHPVPIAAFGGNGRVVLLDTAVPEPSGGTPMAEAIDYAAGQGATHAVMVTDGLPASESATLASARMFGGPIDVFYIGDGRDSGARFAEALAAATGGTVNLTDLGKPKELAGKITLMLGAGNDL